MVVKKLKYENVRELKIVFAQTPVDNIMEEFDNALKSGARLISPIMDRDWGDRACYLSDPEGHIIAFAEKANRVYE